MVWRRDDHEIGPPARYVIYPEMERAAWRGISTGRDALGLLCSCGPQLASQRERTCDGVTGNFMKLDRSADPLDEKEMPKEDKVLRYRRAVYAARRWPWARLD